MKSKTEFLTALGESMGAVLAMSVMYGLIWYFIKTLIASVLKAVGINYFAEIKLSYEWIGKTIIESRSVFNADKATLYRLSNGKFFVELDPIKNLNIKVESICSVTRDRGISPLPDSLDDRYFEIFRQIESADDMNPFFAQDLPASSPLRNELIKNNIICYLAIKVRQRNELYGIVLYTWSDVMDMPRNFIPKHREFIDNIKSILLDEILFVISKDPVLIAKSFFKRRK